MSLCCCFGRSSAITRPPPEILTLFSEQAEIGQTRNEFNNYYNENEKPHTLEEYSLDHFRLVCPKNGTHRLIAFINIGIKKCSVIYTYNWQMPLQPLHKALHAL